MRILIDARLYGLENAGLGRYIINLVREIKRIETENEYVLLLTKKYYKKLNLPKNWKKVPVNFRHYTLREQILLPRIIRKEKPDLTHFPHFNLPLLFKDDFVLTIHDLLMHKFKGKDATTLPPFLYWIKRLGYRAVFDNAVNSSKKILVPTKTVKEEVLREYEIGEDKIVVTYEGVDEKVTAKSDKKVLKKFGLSGDYFFYAGNAYPHKNLERAIEALLQLNESTDEKVILAIACSRDAFFERLSDRIREYNAEKWVKFLGFVTDEELGSLMKNSRAFVYPSLSEGFGLQGLEAMKAGTLVICSDIPVFKEVYEDNAIYFNPYDFSEIAKAMLEVLKIDEKKREKRISKAKKFAGKYSWRKMAEKTLEVYKKALNA